MNGDWRIAIARLRYFNPIGAHRSGRIRESPNGIPKEVMASTPPVLNTAEDAYAIRSLLDPSKTASVLPTRILLVTSAFHMRQTQLLFERQRFVVEPFPVDFQSRTAWTGPLWRDPPNGFNLLTHLMAVPVLCASH